MRAISCLTMALLGKCFAKPKIGSRKSDKSIVVKKPVNKVAIQRSGWSEVT